jgi:hypothetical protein
MIPMVELLPWRRLMANLPMLSPNRTIISVMILLLLLSPWRRLVATLSMLSSNRTVIPVVLGLMVTLTVLLMARRLATCWRSTIGVRGLPIPRSTLPDWRRRSTVVMRSMRRELRLRIRMGARIGLRRMDRSVLRIVVMAV